MKNIEQYLEENYKNGIFDFCGRVYYENGFMYIYLHPQYVAGETVDYEVHEDQLYWKHKVPDSYKIIVNTREITWTPKESKNSIHYGMMTYEEICEIAGVDSFNTPTVTYQTDKIGDSLVRNGATRVKDGMIFEVTVTNNA